MKMKKKIKATVKAPKKMFYASDYPDVHLMRCVTVDECYQFLSSLVKQGVICEKEKEKYLTYIYTQHHLSSIAKSTLLPFTQAGICDVPIPLDCPILYAKDFNFSGKEFSPAYYFDPSLLSPNTCIRCRTKKQAKAVDNMLYSDNSFEERWNQFPGNIGYYCDIGQEFDDIGNLIPHFDTVLEADSYFNLSYTPNLTFTTTPTERDETIMLSYFIAHKCCYFYKKDGQYFGCRTLRRKGEWSNTFLVRYQLSHLSEDDAEPYEYFPPEEWEVKTC